MMTYWTEGGLGTKVLLASGSILMLAAGAAFADDTSTTVLSNTAPVSGVSTASASKSDKTSTPLPIAISDYSLIQGPPVSDLRSNKPVDNAVSVNNGVQPQQPIASEQYFSTLYLASPTLSIGPVLDFVYNFNDVPGQYTKGITWKDSFITVRKKDAIKTKIGNDDFSASIWFNYYAPISQASHNIQSRGSTAVWFNPTYQFHGSHWSLSGYSYVRYYLNTMSADPNTGLDSIARMKAYAGPQINYEISDTVTAFVLYEAVMHLYSGGQTDATLSPGSAATSLTDVEPGIIWSVSKRMTLFPYLNWFVNQSIDTTSIGLNVSLKFL